MNPVDAFLNRHTMCRLTLGGLGVLAAVAIVEAFLGWLPYTAIDLTLSLVVLLFATRTANALCALFTRATPTPESAYITALLLFFILTPLQSATGALVFIIAGALAMLSKYVFALGKVHIFNPAAFAILVVSVAGTGLATWWVGTPVLFPFVLGIGLLVVKKVRRFDLFWIFIGAALAIFAARTILAGHISILGAATVAVQFITSTPLIFFGLFMLMDPLTTPLTRVGRKMYGGFVGFLYAFSAALTLPPLFAFSTFSASPEFALLVGNVCAFVVGKKRKRVALSLHSTTKLSREVYEFSFLPDAPISFLPGQYMEWTLPHASPDNRGIRRYFSMTSAPSDHYVRFCTSMPVECSTFKDALHALKKQGDSNGQIFATGVAGEFMLPQDPDQKILAIAGGVGIAPFMSMFRHLEEQHERRDIVLVYSASTPLDFIYQKEIDFLKDAIGLRVIYLPIDFTELSDWTGASGNITLAFIQKGVSDFKKRSWYLSGSEAQIQEYEWLAQELGMPKSSIKTERFPGF